VSLPTSTMRQVMLPKRPTRSEQPGTWQCQMGEMGLIRESSLLGKSSLMRECTQGGQGSQLQYVSSLHEALAARTANPNYRYATGIDLQRGPRAWSALKQGSTSCKMRTGVCGGVSTTTVSLGRCGAKQVPHSLREARKLLVSQGVRRCPSVGLWKNHTVSRKTHLHQHQLVSQQCIAASMLHRQW
jgi:hypothetical protein